MKKTTNLKQNKISNQKIVLYSKSPKNTKHAKKNLIKINYEAPKNFITKNPQGAKY